MKDLYLKTKTKDAVDSIINPVLPDEQEFLNYYQSESFILDYIGKIPKSINEETGEVLEWSADEAFNIRLIDESVELFNGFDEVYPETPFRVFS